MSDIGIGSFAAGLSQGFGQGYRIRSDVEDRKAARDFQQQHLGIMQQNADMSRQVHETQLAGIRRQQQKAQTEDDAHREALQLLTQGGGGQLDPSLPPDQQVARAMVSGNAFRNPAVLNKVAEVYAKAGLPEAAKWMEHGYRADRENVLDMVDALKRGDTKAAAEAYNSRGSQQVTDIRPAEGKEGTPTGRYRVKFQDGTEGEIDPDQIARSVFSFSEWRAMQADARKAERETAKDQAEINLKRAQAENQLGDNPTKIRVAEIQAGAKGKGSGKGKGAGGGEDGGVDWLDAERRQKINTEIMSAAIAQYSKTPLDPISGKKAPDEYSRNIGEKASRVYLQAIKNGGDMTVESALRIATEGQVTYGTRMDASGKLITKPGVSLNGTTYDDGSAEKPATKDQVLEYLDSTRARAQEAGRQITPDMLKDVPINQWAKQAGMKPQELVDRLVIGPPQEPKAKSASTQTAAPKAPPPPAAQAGIISIPSGIGSAQPTPGWSGRTFNPPPGAPSGVRGRPAAPGQRGILQEEQKPKRGWNGRTFNP